MAVATAIAVALHEILAALIPGANGAPAPEVVERAQIVHVAMHRVVPPARRIVSTAPVPLHVSHRMAPRHRVRAGADRGVLRPHAATPHVDAVAFTGRPVWDTTGEGYSVAPAGGGGSSTGQGDGANGTGEAAAAGDEPCGFVEFSDPHGSRYDRDTGGFYVDIRMSVHFADGSRQSVILDYPWYYANENANPWSDRNVKDPNFPTRFQAPPPARLAAEPALVQYVAQHSTADGMTLLRDCQGASGRRP